MHFRSFGLDKPDMLGRVEYGAVAWKSGEHPGCTTDTSNPGRSSREEEVLMEDGRNQLSELGTSCSEVVESACMAYVGTEDGNIARLWRVQWEAPNGMPPTEALHLYMVHFLSSYHSDFTLYNTFAQRGPGRSSNYGPYLLDSADPKARLLTDCGRLNFLRAVVYNQTHRLRYVC